MYIQIALLLLVLASLVVAYFSAKTWHWGHVLLVLGVFLSAVAYLFLAAETLRINAVWRSQANRSEAELADVKSRIAALERGTDDRRLISALAADGVPVPEDADEIPSLGDLDHQLHLETRIRGQVWRDVMPAGFDAETATLRATVESPQPSGIEADTILFLFEQGEPALPDPSQGAQYLGEFRVTGVVQQEVTLEPMLPMDELEIQRLASSQGPWVLHETMPVDRYSLFTDRTEEQLRAWLPEESVTEYIRQGTEAGPDDDEWHRVGYDESGNQLGPDQLDEAVRVVYQRRLRDYSEEFQDLSNERVLLWADVAAVTKDNERLAEALASARELQAFREEELRKLRVDLAGVTKERKTIERHLADVQQQLTTAQRRLDKALASSSRLAAQLAAMQAKLKAEIDAASSAARPVDPLALNAAAG